MLKEKLSSYLKSYRAEHQSPGCRLCHMIGIPLILISLPLFFADKKRGGMLFAAGWAFQLLGHFFFERNFPMLLTKKKPQLVILSAMVFVKEEFQDLLNRIGILEARDHNGKIES